MHCVEGLPQPTARGAKASAALAAVAALHAAGADADFSYLSLAGGAFLEWLEGKSLPGIVALSQSR